MTEFEYDCLQKKRLAGQAKYRKCGSKSRKCTLTSDMLTQKQWKERCGPIVLYNLNKPMTWESFKKLPSDAQESYITNLQNQYGATAVDIGRMFGVQASTVRKHVDANRFGITFTRGHAMSAKNKEKWEKFLREEDAELHPITEAIDDPIVESDEGQVIAPFEPKSMNMKKVCFQFSGEIDINMIANSLRLILGDHPNGDLEIICNLT